MIKKLFATSAFSLFSFTALAETDTILFSKPGGLDDRLLTIIEESLGTNFGNRITVENCAAAAQYLSNTDKPTVSLWGPAFQFSENGSSNPCALPDEQFIGFFAAAPFHICYKEGNKQAANINYLRTGDVTIGAWSNKYALTPLTSLIATLNPNAKVIPYKSSKNYRPALQAGEIDYTVPTSVKDGEKCLATLGETSVDNLPTVSSMVDHPFSILTYSYTIVGANVDNPDTFVSSVHASEGWINRKDQTYTSFLSDLSRAEQLDWQTSINENIAEKMAEIN